MSRMLSLAAAAVAIIGQAAAGSAVVKNACSHDVYLWVVDNTPGTMQTISPGATWSDPYRPNPNGGGISIKIGATQSHASGITQFEYTLTDTLWYDMSNIDGYPFVNEGITLIPSNSACRSVVCPAGVAICTAAYNQPKDDWATAACTTDSDLTLVLCSHQTDVNAPANPDPAPVPSSSAQPEPTPEPQPEPEPEPEPEPVPVPSSTYVAPPPPPPSSSSTPSPSPTPEPEPEPRESEVVVQEVPSTTQAPEPEPTPEVAVFTTFVTEVFTVFVRSAGPEPTALSKRSAHGHNHKRAEHRHHFHRHDADSN